MVTEVDCLADLRVGLIDRLSGLGSGDLDELTSARSEDVADAMQRSGSLFDRKSLPVACSSSGGFDESINRLVGG